MKEERTDPLQLRIRYSYILRPFRKWNILLVDVHLPLTGQQEAVPGDLDTS